MQDQSGEKQCIVSTRGKSEKKKKKWLEWKCESESEFFFMNEGV